MKRFRALIYLSVIAFLTCAAPAARAAGSTYIGNTTAKAVPLTITRSQSTTLVSSFQILGNGRTNFNDFVWAVAYAMGKTKYAVRYTISVREDVELWFDREIVKPTAYTRTATLVSGTPDMPAPIWVEIQLEDGRIVVPETVFEAQSLMFDVSKSYWIGGTTLGAGNHKLFAQIKANWSGYQFSGTDKKDSPRVTVQVK
ncbi:MAG: hypothetical protein FJ011_18095 [Chloroflexi bacterium]|nr:hypothetical protein [Chloroflexota bacterium]